VGRVLGGHSSRGFLSAPRDVLRGFSSGARYAGGRGGQGYYGGGRAVPRGSVSQPPRSVVQSRHPRAGYGTGFSHGRGYGYGYGRGGYSRGYGYGRNYGYSRGYGYGYRSYRYGRGYYGRSPYYYGYSPYTWGALGLGLGLYFGGGYPYAGGYYAPYYDSGDYVSDEPYAGGWSERDQDYADRGDPREDARAEEAELRLVVLPDDASVWIDGEFRGTARGLARLTLPPGRHQVEVVRPGFRTYTREVEVRPRETTSLRIELDRP
jgi:PEGA domain